MNTQFKKGIIELCVLSLLSRRDFYGYELVERISATIDISEGTVYPLLRRLTREGYFTTYLRESREGPSRKYYRITAEGLRYKEMLHGEWDYFSQAVNDLILEESLP